MIKNVITMAIIGILVISCLVIMPAQANETTLGRQSRLASGIITLTYPVPSVPIISNEVTIIPLAVSYSLVGTFAGLIERSLTRRGVQVPIQLSIENEPDYCQATIFPQIVFCNISGSSITIAELRVVLDQAAPAYSLSNITIKTESSGIRGRLGLLTLVHCAQAEFEVAITIGSPAMD